MKLIYYPDPILETPCEPVTEFDEELELLFHAMYITMLLNKGVELSANQIGVSKRAFVMLDKKGKLVEFVNPEIVNKTNNLANIREGCLSSPDVYDTVRDRAETVSVRYQDKEGEEWVETWSGLQAVCIQHEIDHLDGIFWIDRLSRKERRAANRRWKKSRIRLGLDEIS